ncbi:SLBB domain-containing protein [Leptothermofonsia sp. ETS-13]|uniref:SLBB domain-containing protein n=1 Tax=Leptothermofonsia sp. ETS-13 TaxID=3035696 RepID=UPI003B9EA49E
MSSTTSRLSVVALSTLAALVAQELARTANVAPSTVGSVSEAEDQKGVQPIANPKLTQPVAQPETLPAKPLTSKGQPVKAQKGKLAKSQATAGTSKALSRSAEPTPVLATNEPLPVPLPAPRIHQPLRSVNVDSLPIDAFVSATLRQSASKVASTATAQIRSVKANKSKAVKSEVKKPLPQGAIATGQPQEQQSTQAAKAATLPDIQNHPSQKAIEGLMQRGVIHGSQNGTFRPDDPVSDIEFKIMLRNAFKRSPESVAGIRRPSDVVTRADAAEFVYAQLQRADVIAKAKELPAQPAINASAISTPETVAMEKGASPSAPAAQLASTPTSTHLPDRPTAQPVGLPAQALPGQTPLKQASAMPPRGMPATSLTPTQEDYTLGPGDRIKVEIFGVPEYSRDYQVSVNGNLKLYLVGDLRVQGLTLTQVEKAIAARYARLLQRIKVDVTLTAPRPMNVAIAGEISKPGSYTVASGEGAKFPTVTRLIQQAGGITQSANPNVVYVRRPQANGTDQLITVDLWDLFKTGNIRQDLTLRDGDMVFIPAADQINPADGAQLAAANFAASASQPLNIAIVGEVARPGPYVLSRGRSGGGAGGSSDGSGGATGSSGGLVTVTQAIQQAGGITALADLRNVQVKRTTRSTEPQVITLNLWDMLKTGDLSQDLVLQQGDTITIPTATAINPAEANQLGTASFAPDVIRVNVVGEVVSPGSVQVPPNTTLNQAILAAGGFNNKRAYKKTVELIRLNPNGTATRVSVPVDLSRGIDEKNNPILRNNDIIIVNRSGLARFTDTLDTILGPVNRLLPFFLLGL